MVAADLAGAGLTLATAEKVTLGGVAESAASVATGFLTGTPVSAAVAAREDARALEAAVTEAMTDRLGSGPVTARMSATVYAARHQAWLSRAGGNGHRTEGGDAADGQPCPGADA
ncbi:hypothetical protein [Streptomyces sp. NPDC046759]|uniref:hypothetical protein n=1 Tax=Streptomyces sp. NPDC046759 TaxID=3155019 RepID=UPI003406B04A